MDATPVNALVFAICAIGTLLAFIVAMYAIPLLIRNGLSGIMIILGFLFSVLITLALDIKLLIMLTITLSVTANFLGEQWHNAAMATAHYTFGISILYLVSGFFAEKMIDKLSKRREEHERDGNDGSVEFDTNLINFMSVYRVSAGFFGFIGLVVSFSICLYVLDMTDRAAFGFKYSYGEYMVYSLVAILDNLHVTPLVSSIFFEGEALSSRYIGGGNDWANGLNAIYKFCLTAWFIGFIVFIVRSRST